jgi:Protein of unknown function (DUF2510)
MERWWDGTAWTEYTRTAPVPMAGQPPYPYPSGGAVGSPGGKRRTGLVVIAIVAALVIIGGVVAGIMALGGNSDSNADNSSPSPSATLPGNGEQPPGTQAPDNPSSPADPTAPDTQGKKSTGSISLDANDGISLPILSGWSGTDSGTASAASLVTGSYACPGDKKQACVRGGVFAQPAESLQLAATTAEAAAKADIAANAKASYGSDIYGATTSHQQVASESVTVAGQQGYLVRWKIATKSGTGGYVESLAFPSPTQGGPLVMVRFGFDVGGKAPGVSVMDQITKGIKADSSTSSGTGGAGV